MHEGWIMSRAFGKKNKIDEFGSRLAEACGTSEPAKIQRSLNISYQAAKNYLHGRLPDARILITIAERTPYSIHWLLTGKGEKFSQTLSDHDTPLLARQISALIKQEVQGAVSEILEQSQKPVPRTIVLKADELISETPKETTSPLIKAD